MPYLERKDYAFWRQLNKEAKHYTGLRRSNALQLQLDDAEPLLSGASCSRCSSFVLRTSMHVLGLLFMHEELDFCESITN